jgi:hypothetical protein
MRVLILTGSPARSLAPLQLTDEQITAGPDWPDAQTLDGRWLSLRTPVGDYNLADLLAKIPAEQRPDAIVSLVDARWRNAPRNLRSFTGLKVLALSDRPGEEPDMADIFRYVGREIFDRVLFVSDQAQLGRLLARGSGLPGGLPADEVRAV